METIENGEVETLIVKELSRLGREYLQVGQLTELYFPEKGVRFIAVNDSVDSLVESSNDFNPIRNWANELHAKDTRKKVRSIKKIQAERGKRLGSKPPYGYRKKDAQSKEIIPDEATAPVVCPIFELCAAGKGPNQIARILTGEQILNPTNQYYQAMGKACNHLDTPRPYNWYGKTVANILENIFYLGHTLYGDNVIEKHGINRDSTGDREKTRYLCGKQGIFTRDRALIRPGFIRQLETRASTRSASFFHALGSPGRPHNGGGEAGAYRTRNGAKPLKQGHLRAKRGPLGPSRKSQQQTKRTGFAAHGHSIAETAPEGKRASCANGALIRA